jgi:hypothetical protein
MDQHPRWQEREQQNQVSRWRVWIEPVLGTKKCSALRRSDLEAVLASRGDYEIEGEDGESISKPLSRASMERCKSQLGQWAKWLHANGYTTTNVVSLGST